MVSLVSYKSPVLSVGCDQTAQMSRLIWAFACCPLWTTATQLVLGLDEFDCCSVFITEPASSDLKIVKLLIVIWLLYTDICINAPLSPKNYSHHNYGFFLKIPVLEGMLLTVTQINMQSIDFKEVEYMLKKGDSWALATVGDTTLYRSLSSMKTVVYTKRMEFKEQILFLLK